MRYKLALYETKRKIAIKKQQTEQQALLNEIREAVSHMRYMGLSSGVMRTLEPHQLAAVMDTIAPVVERYVVQAKKRIW
jgi:uncharacterized protein (DUF2344 family)